MMNARTMVPSAVLFTLLILAAPAWASLARAPEPGTQEPAKEAEEKPAQEEKEKEETDLRDFDPFGGGAGGGNPQQEMQELFLKVEKRLQRVTELLFEASSGNTDAANDVGAAGIDELIRDAESQATAAQSDIAKILEASRAQGTAASSEIDRILELAAENAGSGGTPNAPPKSQGQNTPKQGQTPSGSRKEEKGENAPEPGQDSQSEDPTGDEKDQVSDADNPTGNQESEGGEDGEGNNPPTSELGDPNAASGEGEWGDLPIHLRKVFQNGVSDDVPPRYRDWVDSYYKRLSRGSGR